MAKQEKSTDENSNVDITEHKIKTHTGHPLTIKEASFIDNYIQTGNGMRSVIDAGYTDNAPAQKANFLLKKAYIAEEINYRMNQAKTESIAGAEEIMRYFTSVMRGEIKDQFGLDAPLGERTKAAQELAKRKIDIPNKLAGNDAPELVIKLDWARKSADVIAPNSSTEPSEED